MLALFLSASLYPGIASSQEWCQQPICARFEGSDLIRIRAPGRFELTFTKTQGFGAEVYDLQADPDKVYPLSADDLQFENGNGILWTKISKEGDSSSYYANNATNLQLLEAGGARVRASDSGVHHRYGFPDQPWDELGFEQTFTVYATGEIYVDYALVTTSEVSFVGFDLILLTTGDWGNDPSATAPNEGHCIGEQGVDKPYGVTASSFAVMSSNGTRYYADLLMAMYQGLHPGSYWNEGAYGYDYRCGLFVNDSYPSAPAGTTHIPILMRVAQDMNDAASAGKYSDAYRNPDLNFAVIQGVAVLDDPGDSEGDGFNEEEGAYVLRRQSSQNVEFVLHGDPPRENPAFKILDWNGASPPSIQVNGVPWQAGTQFYASTSGTSLILQLAGEQTGDTHVTMLPEPGALLSLGSGLTLLGVVHVRRQRRLAIQR
jgi:hypothetical protein